MTIAFVIQTYSGTGLEQIERLAATLARGLPQRLTIVSHRGSDAELQRLRAHEAIDCVLPSPGGRAGFGLVDSVISCMRWLEKQPKSYDWLVVASGVDYPLRPLHELEAELSAATCDGFFHHFNAMDAAQAAAEPMCWTPKLAVDRYHFQYALLKENVSRLERAVLKLPRMASEMTRSLRLHSSFSLMIGTRPAQLPFNEGFKLYGGDHWMIFNRNAANVALEFVDTRPDLVEYFRHVVAPQEAFLPTVFANDPRLVLASRQLRYIEFGGLHGHATEFGASDLERVLASGCYMARKFSLRKTPELFEQLDARIFDSGSPASSAQAA